MSSHQNMLAWKVCITIVHFLALASTLVRFHHHWKTKQLWLDDYLVVTPWFFDLIGMILFWIQYHSQTVLWESVPYDSFFFSWWFICFLAFSIIWQSRIAMSFSIARIFMPGHAYRTVALCFATLLCSFYATSLVVVSTLCRGSPWYNFKMKTCMGSDRQTIAFVPSLLFAFDVIADVFLIAVPLLMLRKINFPRSERTLILSLFSSSALTLLGTILYCGFFNFLWNVGPNSRLLFVSLGHLQASLSLFAANLLVVTMLVYKIMRGSRKYRMPMPTPLQAGPQLQPQSQPQRQPEPATETAELRPEEENYEQPQAPSSDHSDRPPSVFTHITLTIMSEAVCFTDPSLNSYDRSSIPLQDRKSYWDDRLVATVP